MIIRVVAAAMLLHNRLFCARRSLGKWAGYWELPGGKVEEGETDQEALTREIFEELGMNITVGNLLGEFEFPNPDRPLTLVVYYAQADREAPVHMTDHDSSEWIDLDSLHSKRWAPADLPAIQILSGLNR